jgi:DNA-binding transcriptional MerR regulator
MVYFVTMNDAPPETVKTGSNPGRLKIKRPGERRYYSIADVAKETELKPYVLRFWEKEFPALRPKKNRAGNRTYQRKDIDLILRIKHLLYEEGFTIKGARDRLKQEQSGAAKPPDTVVAKRVLGDIRRELEAIVSLLPR